MAKAQGKAAKQPQGAGDDKPAQPNVVAAVKPVVQPVEFSQPQDLQAYEQMLLIRRFEER